MAYVFSLVGLSSPLSSGAALRALPSPTFRIVSRGSSSWLRAVVRPVLLRCPGRKGGRAAWLHAQTASAPRLCCAHGRGAPSLAEGRRS